MQLSLGLCKCHFQWQCCFLVYLSVSLPFPKLNWWEIDCEPFSFGPSVPPLQMRNHVSGRFTFTRLGSPHSCSTFGLLSHFPPMPFLRLYLFPLALPVSFIPLTCAFFPFQPSSCLLMELHSGWHHKGRSWAAGPFSPLPQVHAPKHWNSIDLTCPSF